MSYGQENYATGYEQAPHQQQPHQQQQPQQMADPQQQMQNGGNLESVLLGIGKNRILLHLFKNAQKTRLCSFDRPGIFPCIAPPGDPSSIFFFLRNLRLQKK